MPAACMMPDVKVQLERAGFYPGQRVAGVVTVNVTRPTHLRGVRIRLVGMEHVQVHYGRQTRWISTAVVDQEVVLVGRERLPDAGAVVVDTWDTILQRARHSRLMPGEYVYPFSIPVPSYAPPTYRGKAARVDYELQLTVDRPMRRSRIRSMPFRVFPPGREGTAHPLSVAISGSELAPEASHARSPQASLSVSLARQEFHCGDLITGDFEVQNPSGELLEGLVLSLHAREETNAQGGSGGEQWDLLRQRTGFKDMTAGVQKGKLQLQIPDDAVPSISGRTFQLTYSLDVRLAAPSSSDLTLRTEIQLVPPPAQG